jgi:hypothetical protein
MGNKEIHENCHYNPPPKKRPFGVPRHWLETNIKMDLTRNWWVSTPNILTRKSEEGPLPYCKTEAELKGNNWPDSLVIEIGCNGMDLIERCNCEFFEHGTESSGRSITNFQRKPCTIQLLGHMGFCRTWSWHNISINYDIHLYSLKLHMMM